MRSFNDSDFELMKVYEEKFDTAINSRFVSGISQDALKQIAVIYREVLGRNATLSCSGCVLQMLTMVGRVYYTYKNKLEDDARKKRTTRKSSKTTDKPEPDNK